MNNGNEIQHINFVYEDRKSSDTFYEQGHSIHLLNPFYEINFFEIIPKNFKIATNNGSFYFNIDMLIDTSSIIAEFVVNNPGIFDYHLDITDENNVLEKIEQIYQGKVVIFDENDLSVFLQIKNLLNLIKIPNIEKQQYKKENIYFSSVVISKESFHSFISNETFRTFKIVTNNHEYNCNSIGIQFSKVIQLFILQNPTKSEYIYDFDDDFSEFQYICDFFNLKKVNIQPENMHALRKVCEDLEITIILNDINKYINEYEQLNKVVDEQQSLADSISELFNYLYQIENLTISKVKCFILESEWSSSIEKIQELAAFILQVAKSDFLLQNSMIDLLIELNDEENQMQILIPFIVSKLMNLFGESKQNCSFIYKLHQKGFIPKEEIETKLYEVYFQKREEKCFVNVFDWFFPEIVQLTNDDELKKIINKFDDLRKTFFYSYLPDKLDKYKEMLNSGEPSDIITKLIRCDDVNSLRSITIIDEINILKNVIPYNIYEDFIQNDSTNYLNYAAAYGSVKCFKLMLLSHAVINPLSFEYAVYGGNCEIIHIIDQNSPNDFPPIILKNFKFKNDNKFIQAIQKHRNDLFKWLIEEKIDINDKNHNLLNKLAIVAVQNGNAFSLIELIEKGYVLFDILKLIQISAENGFVLLTKILLNIAKARNLKFSSIIKSIISFGNLSIFVLFANAMNQNDINNSLKYSIENDYKNITEYIFDNLLDTKFGNQVSFIEEILNISVRKKENALFFCILNKLQNLSSSIEKEINWEEKILPNACKYSHFLIVQKIIKLIIQHKSNDKHDLTESFKQAAISGSIDICQYLANCYLEINYEQLSKSGNELHSIKESVFSFMIDQSSPNLKDSFCDDFIYHSIINNNEELVAFILKQKPDLLNKISSSGTPLIIASEKNYISIVKYLLSLDNIDLSLTNLNNETALQIAMNNINAEIVIAIINHYGDNILSYINEVQNLMIKEIQYLSKIKSYDNKKKENIHLILDRIIEIKNIDINYIHNNYSFLFYACEMNDIKLCEKLLKCDNIDVNISIPPNGITPIISALDLYNYDIVEMLINHPNINLYVKNINNNDAITVIIRRQNAKLIKLLADKDNPDALYEYGYMLENGFGIPMNKKEAVSYYKKASHKMNTKAMISLGKMLESGKGISVNLEEACKYFKMAADKGNSLGMNNYGIMLEDGKGIPVNFEEACKYYKMSADKGNLHGMVNYGHMLVEGKGIPVNLEEACKYFKITADKGNARGMDNYGRMLENGKGIEKNIEKACEYYKMSADEGDPIGMNDYGVMLSEGKGIPINFVEACIYFKMSADKGNLYGMVNYGIMLENGKGIPVNFEEACKYYKMSADKGNLHGMVNYGYMLVEGKGIPVNLEEACKYYKKAADGGHSIAMFTYGSMLERGKGIPVNLKEACKYYKMAADNGNNDGMNKYGVMLKIGKGIPVNFEEACKYFKMAADKGDPLGMNNYGSMLESRKGISVNFEEACKYFKMAADKGDSLGMYNYGLMLENGKGIPVNLKEARKYYKMSADEGNSRGAFSYGCLLMRNAENEEACKYFKKSADAGNPLGMNNLAYMLNEGKGIAKNAEEALKLLKMSSDLGNSDGMTNYGYMLENGIGTDINIEKAIKYYKMAADKGNSIGMVYYGYILYKGKGIAMNYEKAVKYYKMAADKGNPDGMFLYGYMLDEGKGIAKNAEEACKYYKMSADNGQQDGIINYGYMLSIGRGVQKDINEALRYYKLAIDQGNSTGMNNYGWTLFRNSSKYEDYEIACKYFKMAIEKNNYCSMINYGFMLDNGYGVQIDHDEANKYYIKVIEDGETERIFNFAQLLDDGGEDKGTIDKKEACRYYKIAADADHTESIFRYATMFENGIGIESNKEEAIRYFKMAADKGHKDAINSLERLVE